MIAGILPSLGTHDGTVVVTPYPNDHSVTVDQEMVEAVNGEKAVVIYCTPCVVCRVYGSVWRGEIQQECPGSGGLDSV